MNWGRMAIIWLVALGLAMVAGSSLAVARVAYVTGATSSEQAAFKIDLATGSVAPGIELGGEGTAEDVAITPDGKTAYVINLGMEGDEVTPIDVATNVGGTPIPLGQFVNATAIAITPDGSSAYVTGGGIGSSNVYEIDLASGTVVDEISFGIASLSGIAITPDGKTAYVAGSDAISEGHVFPIDLATGAIGASIEMGPLTVPHGIAITPDGTRAYVTLRADNSVQQINLATNAIVGTGTTVGPTPQSIAITPDGTRAYVASYERFVTAINLVTNTPAETDFEQGHFLGDVATLPDGSRAYVTDTEAGENLVPFDIPANTKGSAIPMTDDRPDAIAIVPNQGPRAAFTAAPQPGLPGESIAFNAGGSSDSDGSVVRYQWDFGDGTTASSGGASPSHSYAKAGTYTVTLTVTDNEGCSTTIVFTGQTAHCNGSVLARTTRTVTVGNCPQVAGSATSFVPKLRSAHVVPGIRVRLAVSAPARLAVTSTLLWDKDGESGTAALRKVTVNVDRWRRVRLAIPVGLREKLPLGTPVKVRLRINARPRNGSSCTGGVTRRTLKLQIAKVIPNRAQSNPTQ